MIPAAFDYAGRGVASSTRSSCSGREDAKLLAGGHSLLPAMKLRISRPALLVDVGRLHDLAYVREDGDAIAIGALTRHARSSGASCSSAECGAARLHAPR